MVLYEKIDQKRERVFAAWFLPFYSLLVTSVGEILGDVCRSEDSDFPNNQGRGHHGVKHNTGSVHSG